MPCRQCGFEQPRGRFCGRCGTAVPGPPEPDASLDLSGPVGESSSTARSLPTRRLGRVRLWAPVAVLVVAVAGLMGWMASQSADEAPAADDSTTASDTDDAAPDDEPPPDPVEEPETPELDELEATDDPGSPPEGFRDPTGTVLLFDDGGDGALAVDLDTWEQQRVELPGQRPGDQPFRLWQMGSWVVVGWEEVWAVAPGQPEMARQLGEATVFLPHAKPDALWLIDYEGGRIGSGASTWTLIDASGTELAEVSSMPAGLLPDRGVPGGLAVDAPNGTLVYDLEQGRLVDNPVDGAARVADVTRERVAWCDDDPCKQLVITDADRAAVATVGSDETFSPAEVWLSPGGDWLAWILIQGIEPHTCHGNTPGPGNAGLGAGHLGRGQGCLAAGRSGIPGS